MLGTENMETEQQPQEHKQQQHDNIPIDFKIQENDNDNQDHVVEVEEKITINGEDVHMESSSDEEVEEKTRKPKERLEEDQQPQSVTLGGNKYYQLKERIEVDRKTTCPFLLRVFCKHGSHNRLEDFSPTSVPTGEFQIHTWKDATLNEIAELIKSAYPPAKRQGISLSFKVVFRHPQTGEYIMKDAANRHQSIIGNNSSTQLDGNEESPQLGQLRFQIGDFLDVALVTYSLNRRNHQNKRMRSDHVEDYGSNDRHDTAIPPVDNNYLISDEKKPVDIKGHEPVLTTVVTKEKVETTSSTKVEEANVEPEKEDDGKELMKEDSVEDLKEMKVEKESQKDSREEEAKVNQPKTKDE